MRVLSEPLAWIVVPVVACGLWFFASGVRKANLLFGRARGEDGLRAWRALGDAPLDVVAREVRLAGEAAKPPPASRKNPRSFLNA
jgi:hypothetical protein